MNDLRHAARLFGLQLIGRVYPRPRPTAAAPRSLLLIRPDHVGDLLFLTPALHALRMRLPETRITLLVGPWGRAVIGGNPDADATLTCPFPGFERQPKTNAWSPYRLLFATARQLRSHAFDTAVILRFDHWWGAWLAATAGIHRRIGYNLPETRPFLTDALPYQAGRHEVRQNAALLAPLAPGLASSLGPTRFPVTDAERIWAADWLSGRGCDPARRLIAIHPGAGAAVKQWPAAAWAEAANRLSQAYSAQILLTGGLSEKPLTAVVAAGLSQPALDAAGETTLGQLAALYERCALVLGPDCGPLHLATAVGAATVHLYGPVSPRKFGPWGDPARHIVLASNWACAPCDRLDWPSAALPQHACMAAITPQEVVEAVGGLVDW